MEDEQIQDEQEDEQIQDEVEVPEVSWLGTKEDLDFYFEQKSYSPAWCGSVQYGIVAFGGVRQGNHIHK